MPVPSILKTLDPKARGAYYVPSQEVQNNSALVSGFTAPGFEEVKALLEYSIKIGDDVGAGVAAYVDGELKVNLYGGHATEDRRTPYDANSLSLVFSCSKPVAHILVAMFVDKKLLSWDDPVTKYWPEFGVGNKEGVTVGDIVTHRGGVGWFDWDITLDDTEDLDRLAEKLAKQEHNWEGKRTQSYSGMTGGYYVNEILRRVDPQHRTLGKILQDDVLPLLKKDGWTPEFYYSLPEDQEPRLAPFIGYPKLGLMFRLFMPKWLWTPSEGFGLHIKKSASSSSVKGSLHSSNPKLGGSGTVGCAGSKDDTSPATSPTKLSKSKSKLWKSKPKLVERDSEGEVNEACAEKRKPKNPKPKPAVEAAEASEDEELISPVFRKMLNKSSVAGKSLAHSTPVKDFPAGYNDRRVRKSEHPSFSGVTNARSVRHTVDMGFDSGF